MSACAPAVQQNHRGSRCTIAAAMMADPFELGHAENGLGAVMLCQLGQACWLRRRRGSRLLTQGLGLECCGERGDFFCRPEIEWNTGVQAVWGAAKNGGHPIGCLPASLLDQKRDGEGLIGKA